MLTQELVNDLLIYKDGELFRKRLYHKSAVNKPLGTSAHGYLQFSINSKAFMVHRVIYLMHHGYLPKYVDHIDRNTLNNKIENLRECTKSQNSHNQTLRAKNKSGIKGVYWNKDNKRWHAQIGINRKRKHVGFFKTVEEARHAMVEARIKYHGEFANHC